MNASTLKKMALALTFWLAVHMPALKAQILGPYGRTPTTFEVDANGLLLDTGTFGTGTLSLSGAGTRMFWYPGKAAFRAGNVGSGWVGGNTTDWDDANIGLYSAAFGLDTTASGRYSFAEGEYSTASERCALALGGFTTASGLYSVALGYGTTASNQYAVALGYGTTASGPSSLAVGSSDSAIGEGAVALGGENTASGWYSTSLGCYNFANGNFATASGIYTQATACSSFVVGTLNTALNEDGVSAPNPNSWVPTDPLFEIGNGGSPGSWSWGGGWNWGAGAINPNTTQPSDALVVYKNGDTAIQGNLTTGGVITAAPGGDIPMYSGN